jgi:hypothetical protein
MSYCIIHKIENNNGSLKYTPIGYSADEVFIQEINDTYDSILGNWIESNKIQLEDGSVTATDYFTTNGVSFLAKTTSTNVDGLTQLTDLNGL